VTSGKNVRFRPWAALTLSLSLCGCTIQPPRSDVQKAADENLAAEVEAALDADPTIYARHIDVSVYGGVVHLGGFVWSPRDFLVAKADAATIPGVLGVADEMELMRGGMSGTSR
jgi:osmotically-inducible protein OsmY